MATYENRRISTVKMKVFTAHLSQYTHCFVYWDNLVCNHERLQRLYRQQYLIFLIAAELAIHIQVIEQESLLHIT